MGEKERRKVLIAQYHQISAIENYHKNMKTKKKPSDEIKQLQDNKVLFCKQMLHVEDILERAISPSRLQSEPMGA